MFSSGKGKQWLKRLVETELDGAFNPWRQSNDVDLPSDGPGARLERLVAHFSVDAPRVMLIGEAPGYQGARISGVAFTSERLLQEGAIPRLEHQAQRRITTRPRPYSEPSATIVWKEAFQLGIASSLILWNAFPFHPYRTDNPESNRAPTSAELSLGLDFLDELIDLLQPQSLVAVGRNAQASVAALGRAFEHIRHPSMGGAPEFREGLTRIVRGTRRAD